VLQAESAEAMAFRLHLIRLVADMLAHMLDLLGIDMPERM
jgi:arginyl-tRNA synthetase